MKPNEELTVITETYDLILWTCNHVSRFPRSHRFGLGQRIERGLYDASKRDLAEESFNAQPQAPALRFGRPYSSRRLRLGVKRTMLKFGGVQTDP
jgi:hypothetical protein